MANRVNLGNIIGATGATGPQGPAGQNGVNGETPYIQNGTWWIGSQDTHKKALGDKWYYGTDIPTIQGNNGDLYLRTNTADVYYKEDGIWSIIANIKGAKGDKGDKGDTALSVTVGTVTTANSDTPASVTNSGTSTDLVLDFVIPKGETGEQGEKGDTGASSVFVGGFLADTISFDSDPQGQIDNKLSGNFGSENAGKYLQVDNNGNVQAVSSDAENDVIDGYYYNGAFYEDSEHTIQLVGASGKIYIDVVENLQYRYNGSSYVPLTSDTSGKADKTEAVGSIELSVNSSTFVVTLQAKNVNGQNVGIAQTIDLPLESVVVSGSYNSQTKKVVLTLQNGSTIEFSVADLVAGLQSEITSSNKLGADLVDDTSSTNKFVTSTEKATWNAKADTSDIPVLKTFTNTSVSTWVADNTYTGYGYKASITLSGVTADMIPQVIFGATEATSGNYLPIAESYAGGIYIWSKVNDTITIPTITVQKAVA